jgi:uncharacterized protein YegP (UPF0339 family)
MKRTPRIEIFSNGSEWFFHLRSVNGKLQLQSEPYPTKAHAQRGAVAAQKAMSAAVIVVV